MSQMPYNAMTAALLNNATMQPMPDAGGDPMMLASAAKNRQQRQMQTVTQGLRANGGRTNSPLAQHVQQQAGQPSGFNNTAPVPPDALTAAQTDQPNYDQQSAYTPAMAQADAAKGGANVQVQRGVGPTAQTANWNSNTLQETTPQQEGQQNFLAAMRQGLNPQDAKTLDAFGAAGGTPEQMMSQRNSMRKGETSGVKKPADEQSAAQDALIKNEQTYGDTLSPTNENTIPGSKSPVSDSQKGAIHQQQMDLYRKSHPGLGPEQGMSQQQGQQNQPSAKNSGWVNPSDNTVHQEGTVLNSPSTGKQYKITNGVPVEIPNG